MYYICLLPGEYYFVTHKLRQDISIYINLNRQFNVEAGKFDNKLLAKNQFKLIFILIFFCQIDIMIKNIKRKK